MERFKRACQFCELASCCLSKWYFFLFVRYCPHCLCLSLGGNCPSLKWILKLYTNPSCVTVSQNMETCFLFITTDSWRVMAPFFIPGNLLLETVMDSCIAVQFCYIPCAGKYIFGSLWWNFVTLGSRKDGDKNPVWFTLGIREVLKGWDKGLQNMCTGERRKLTIPPSLAYGKEGKGNIDIQKSMLERVCCRAPLLSVFQQICFFYMFTGKIPPSSTLIFDIELMDIQNGPRSHESFREMDLNDDWKLSRQEVWNYFKLLLFLH